MDRLLQGLGLFLLSCSAFAIDSEPTKTTTSTTWEIYGVVLAVLVVGFLWVAYQQKKEKDREQRRQQRNAGRS